MIKALAKRVAHVLLGDFSIYRIYRWRVGEGSGGREGGSGEEALRIAPLDAAALAGAAPELADLDDYLGDGCEAFGCWSGGTLIGAAFYWHGQRYASRGYWPLQPGEAKLVQITVSEAARGRGVARALIGTSSIEMRERGFGALYARVWHSNVSSSRAFEAAGWSHIATVIETEPLLLGRRRWVMRPSPRT